MGKASKWIISLLLGKKEEKTSIEALPSPSYHNIATSTPTPTPKVKRRWSFGRSSMRDSTNSKLQLLNLGTQINQIKHENEEELLGQSAWRGVENAAAVKIQSIFRSYLARKALWALRGLVKLQAVARGHLVRKRTASTLHRMHALMAIQLRARLNRLNPTTNSNNVLQPKYAYSSRQQTRILRLQDSPASTNSKIYPARASYSYDRPHHHSLVPTFMAGTQSSKAKSVSSKPKIVRSSSEPKQRPKWITNHKMTLTNETDARTQLSSSHSQHFPPGSLDPWFFELYGSSTRSSRDYNCECDSLKSNYPSLEVLNPSKLWL